VAVNKFRKEMDGQVEDIRFSEDGEVILVNRGDKGAALINLSAESNFIELPTGLADGEYADVVYGQSFTVENGLLKGTAQQETTYIIVSK
jgi:alpha-amylase